MKRFVAYLFAFVLAATLAAAGFLGWVVATTDGARWFLDALSIHGGLKMSVGKVEGRMLDHLFLGGIKLDQPLQKLEIDSLELRWKPLLLLAGTVGVQELKLGGVRIHDNTPPSGKPLDLAWPRVRGRASLFEGKIARFQLDGLNYRRLDKQPLILSRVAASITWQEMLLSLGDLSVVSPAGRAAGNIVAGFQRPSLSADLDVTPAQPVAKMERFSLQTRLLHGRAPEQLAGTLLVSGSGGGKGTGASKERGQRLELAGDVGMTRSGFNLRHLKLTRPGQSGRVSAEGTLLLAAPEPHLRLRIDAVDLAAANGRMPAADLSGTLTLQGTAESYRGNFAFANRGKAWQAVRVSGSYQGDGKGLKLAPLKGSLLSGTLQGNLELGWSEGVTLRGALSARSLNPAAIAPDWTGVANFDLAGSLSLPGKNPLHGEVNARLLESSLHGQALRGELNAGVSGDNFLIRRLALQGRGFDITASGELAKRLNFAVQVGDLSRLVPETAGELRAEGWLRRQAGRVAGSVTAHAGKFSAKSVRIAGADLTAALLEGQGYPLRITANLRQVVTKRFQIDTLTLIAGGTALGHNIDATLRSGNAEAQLALAGAYSKGGWQGKIVRFSGHDSIGPWNLAAPAALAVNAGRITLAPLVINGVSPERIEISADLTRNPLGGSLRADWSRLNLARAEHWLKDVRVAGGGSGSIRLGFLPGDRLNLAGSASAMGTVTAGGRSVTVQRSQLKLDGDDHGLRAALEIYLAGGTMLKGNLDAPGPSRAAIPDAGKFALEWKDINLDQFRAWMPDTAKLDGSLAGRAAGRFLPGQRFEMEGESSLSRGRVQREGAAGELSVNLRAASVSWSWRDDSLAGALALTLAEYGQARGSYQLPLAARFPVALDPKGPVLASVSGRVQEKGVLSAFFPGIVQESRGEINADLKVDGRWEEPRMAGQLRLAGAGAYLPKAGINIKDVSFTAHLEKDLIRIDSLRAVSGPGHIEGNALLKLKGWQLDGYSGSISGERFQIVHFPELQIQSSPKLTFEGTTKKLTLRGEVLLPELNIVGAQPRAVIEPSSDVVVEGRVRPVKKPFPLALDVQVRMVLGDRVQVKTAGVDAQLGGALDLTLFNLNRITSKGEIRVVKGRYRTYGVNLEIDRGRLFYAGGSIEQPTLDILALRTVGDVKAGVTVTGTLRAPVTKLYSDPGMPDVDILAYIVLGHPLGSSGEQASLLTRAAGVLLSSSQSESLQDQIKNRLGLSTMEIQSATAGTSSHLGYKPLPVTPPGSKTTIQPAGISQTMLTVGKYLTPELYFSYGRSLFGTGNQFLLRYDIFKNLQLETQTGSESGADLYYKIEFN